MRQADDNLRYQPLFELSDSVNKRSMRLGSQVLSYHQLAPYDGWSQFEPRLHEVVDQLFAKSDNITIRRLGLRYLNALRSDVHKIRGIADIDLVLVVSEESLSKNVNLNYTQDLSSDTQCSVRIATTDFVQGALPANSSVYVDVDVFTKEGFRSNDAAAVKRWLSFAHGKEKESFFSLLKESTIKELQEN